MERNELQRTRAFFASREAALAGRDGVALTATTLCMEWPTEEAFDVKDALDDADEELTARTGVGAVEGVFDGGGGEADSLLSSSSSSIARRSSSHDPPSAPS